MSNLPTEKVVIIGSGPAGWTAAIYAARANLQPLIFPGRAAGKDLLPGGQLMFTGEVENFPGFEHGISGPDLMQQMFKQAMRVGTRAVTDDGIQGGEQLEGGLFSMFQNVESVDLSKRPFHVKGDNGFECLAETVIIATGAKANWLGLDNEIRLAQSGGGVSACAVCDGAMPMFRNQELAVVGAGDSAIEEATYLTKFASKVHMLVRRGDGEMRASKIMQDRAKNNPKIQIHWNTEVLDVLGDKVITGLKLVNNKTKAQSELAVKGLFMAIGHTPITQFLKGQLPTDDKGYLLLEDPYRSTTKVPGCFVAGDVADHVYRQAITAAGMGCKSALDAERFLAEHGVH